ncbi:MAG TPA: CPBP family intramembrane glutamic endopeptidase [Homoserinimonas sp.]|nr:CPBP family intramembrane glutamic endopeptidase [Homoserinimonas sp.]
MLSPSFPATPAIAAVMLGALLVWLMVRAIRKDRREYGRFKRYRTTVRRQRLYRKWVLESFLVFGGSALVVTVILWQHIPLFFDDYYSLPAIAQFGHLVSDTGGLIPGLTIGATVTLIVGSIVGIYLARHSDEVPAIGDIAALLPRNRAELRYGALLSVNAGVVEELLFRLAFPVLIFAATGSAAIAVAGSIALFGLLHVYQGIWGVIGSLVIGTLLMAVFLATGSILLAVLLHALIDLRSLVLIPVVVYRVHRVTGGAHRTTAPAAR